MPGSNLAMFGLQSATTSLQSAAIRTVPHGLGCVGRNKKHVRISKQSAMFGPLPARCGANAAIARTPVCIDCAAGQIYAHITHSTHPPSAHAHQGTMSCTQQAQQHAPCAQAMLYNSTVLQSSSRSACQGPPSWLNRLALYLHCASLSAKANAILLAHARPHPATHSRPLRHRRGGTAGYALWSLSIENDHEWPKWSKRRQL